MTEKDNKLIIGSIGKEWINPAGVSLKSKRESIIGRMVTYILG